MHGPWVRDVPGVAGASHGLERTFPSSLGKIEVIISLQQVEAQSSAPLLVLENLESACHQPLATANYLHIAQVLARVFTKNQFLAPLP